MNLTTESNSFRNEVDDKGSFYAIAKYKLKIILSILCSLKDFSEKKCGTFKLLRHQLVSALPQLAFWNKQFSRLLFPLFITAKLQHKLSRLEFLP